MRRAKSLSAFIDELLDHHGFQRRGKDYWHRFERKAVIVVNLQKSVYGGGMYMNYGLLFVKDQQRLFPKEYECTVFGRNPGLSRLDFARFQNLLGDVSLLLRNPDDLAEVARFLQIQLAVLLEWATDRQALVKRVAQGGHLEMIVDGPALGLTA